MSILNGVVAMELDSMGYEEPSTPLKDPTSSPAVHIHWQNSQSACAAMEELRVASSVPRRPPKPLTFDFELPASAGPSSHASDPFFTSRTRARPARLRTLETVQSHSQNDVVAIPAADASKFLDMLGRASARVDENSRKRMRALGGERTRASKRSSIKGKERMCATTRAARSMDELGDHTNFIRDASETALLYSSLPIILQSQSKDALSQLGSALQADYKGDDVHTRADADAPAPGNDGVKPPVSARPQNGAQCFPLRAALTARHSQKRIEPPSPTPIRSVPIQLGPVPAPSPAPAPAPTHRPKSSRTSESAPPRSTPGLLSSHHPPAPLSASPSTHIRPQTVLAPTPQPLAADNDGLSKGIAVSRSVVPMADSFARHSTSAAASISSTSLISAVPPPSQTHGSRRALGMTRNVPLSSSNSTRHCVAAKKPFRPPIARPAATVTSASVRQVPPTSVTASSHHKSQRQQRQEKDGRKKGSGADPDSSFDLSFDFDPDALEAAMKKYD